MMMRLVKAVCIVIVAFLYVSTDKCNGRAIGIYDPDPTEVPDYTPTTQMDGPTSQTRLMFQYFDADGDGYLSYDEFKKFVKTYSDPDDITEQDIDDMFNDTDKNEDGKLDYTEFSKEFSG